MAIRVGDFQLSEVSEMGFIVFFLRQQKLFYDGNCQLLHIKAVPPVNEQCKILAKTRLAQGYYRLR